MLDIICGDPWRHKDKPATYTRFVLPFHYRPAKKRSNAAEQAVSKLVYQKMTLGDIGEERLSYFTSDTANVLFDKTLWAKISGSVWNDYQKPIKVIAHNKNEIEVMVSSPTIVLFEWEEPVKQDIPQNDILKNGFLMVELFFNDDGEKSVTLEDLLMVNELFRYFRSPYKEHKTKGYAEFISKFNISPKESDAAHSDGSIAGESNIYLDHWLTLLKYPLEIDGQMFKVIPDEWLENDSHCSYGDNLNCNNEKCLIYADNRAFVWTCATVKDKDGAELLQREFPKKEGLAAPYNYGHWVKLLNVDKVDHGIIPIAVDSSLSAYERQWAKEKTYDRWAESGTFYGYSYHSGAMLGPSEQLVSPFWKHFGGMYFDQIILLFYIRISLFSFSKSLTQINHEKRSDGQKSDLRKKFRGLRRDFARFTNLYQFPLISNQQQGMEMYDIARNSLAIDKLFDMISNEISSTHEFLEMEASSELAKRANVIATLGIPLAVTALVTSIISMPQELFNSLKGCWFKCPPDWSFILQMAIIFMSWIGSFCITKKMLKKGNTSEK